MYQKYFKVSCKRVQAENDFAPLRTFDMSMAAVVRELEE